jgi:hypothetical protein
MFIFGKVHDVVADDHAAERQTTDRQLICPWTGIG